MQLELFKTFSIESPDDLHTLKNITTGDIYFVVKELGQIGDIKRTTWQTRCRKLEKFAQTLKLSINKFEGQPGVRDIQEQWILNGSSLWQFLKPDLRKRQVKKLFLCLNTHIPQILQNIQHTEESVLSEDETDSECEEEDEETQMDEQKTDAPQEEEKKASSSAPEAEEPSKPKKKKKSPKSKKTDEPSKKRQKSKDSSSPPLKPQESRFVPLEMFERAQQTQDPLLQSYLKGIIAEREMLTIQFLESRHSDRKKVKLNLSTKIQQKLMDL